MQPKFAIFQARSVTSALENTVHAASEGRGGASNFLAFYPQNSVNNNNNTRLG